MKNYTHNDELVQELNEEELKELWSQHEDPDTEDFISEEEFWNALEGNKQG